MATDLTIHFDNRVGTLAELGEALGNAGVNIEGIVAAVDLDEGQAHILVDDEAAARTALEAVSWHIHGSREVLLLEMTDEPGELGKVARKLADAGVNVDLIYVATGNRLVVAAEDMEKARSAV